MNKLYAITDKTGRHLCYQVANSASEAVDFARMYGHRAVFAELIRED